MKSPSGCGTRATDGPIGVCFSGGVDSGSVFLVAYHAMLRLGMSPSRLKAFTLSVDGGGEDLAQARSFLDARRSGPVPRTDRGAARPSTGARRCASIEDYKPLDVQSAAMALALCRGIRSAIPDWRYLLDGDGGDENLKDYPIEENPELTIRSVLNNRMLYQEGWGVDAIKHSLTYSGGLSRGYARTYAPAAACGFDGFSPFTLPNVMEIGGGDPVHRPHRLGPRTPVRSQGRGRPRAASRPSPGSTCRSSPSGGSSTGRAAPRRSTLFFRPASVYRRAYHAIYDS